MPPRRRFDKKAATTFNVVHRAHDDALYFDNDAARHVLVPVDEKNTTKKVGITRSELESRLKTEKAPARDNEGLAAQYGIFYDDTKYDYMQHLKPIGQEKDAVFIAKKDPKADKPKKADLFDLLKDQMASSDTNYVTQDNFESIPLELKGFNPDMDPRLREALEALEDEAYITSGEDEEDVFNSLLKSGAADEDEYYGSEAEFVDDEDEWDLDNYQDEYDAKYDSDTYQEQEHPYNQGEAPEEHEIPALVNTGWEKDVKKFMAKKTANDFDSDDDFEDDNDDVPELPTFGSGAKKSNTKLRKKKGAMTDTSSFSMSSSALFRTEGLTLLDDRFETLTKNFEKDEDEEYKEFNMEEEREDLEDMLDDFLENFELERGGRKLMKKNEEIKRVQEAADAVSKGKAAARRRKQKNEVGSLGSSFDKLNI